MTHLYSMMIYNQYYCCCLGILSFSFIVIIYIYMYMHIYTYIYIYICVFMHICMYIYIYEFLLLLLLSLSLSLLSGCWKLGAFCEGKRSIGWRDVCWRYFYEWIIIVLVIQGINMY